ncbi:MAG TPA: hypothetical protein VHY08_28790 [Bacillota bacterium]|nr:hypothetical protein [Bacillota bacterium]
MKKMAGLLLIMIVILSGCMGGVPNPTPKGGSLVININSAEFTIKTIEPTLDMTITTYDIYGLGPDGTSFRKENVNSSNVTIPNLAAGNWTITVDAKNDEGTVIASGYTNPPVNVIAGASNNAKVILRPLSGSGALRVAVSWPANLITNPLVTGILTPKDGTGLNINFILAGDNLSATYENSNLNSGYYTLLTQLKDGTTVKWGAIESVRIITGQTAEGSFPLTSSPGQNEDISLIITPDLQNPITFTFSGQQENLPIGTEMTVTAHPSEVDIDSYQWYLNGRLLVSENGNSVTIGKSLAAGNYRLDVVVTKGNIISTGFIVFNVVVNKWVVHDLSIPGLSANVFPVDRKSVLIDQNEKIHFFAGSPELGPTYCQQTSNGWVAESVGLPQHGPGWDASMIFGNNPKPYILFYNDSAGGPYYGLNFMEWNSSSWAQTRLDAGFWSGKINDMKVDSLGNVHLIYSSNDGYLKYAKRIGGTWSTSNVEYTGFKDGVNRIALALDESNHAYIAYVHISDQKLRFGKFNGSTWQLQDIETLYTGNSWGPWLYACPSIIVDSNNNPHIAYGYLGPEKMSIKYAKFNGASWSFSTVDEFTQDWWSTIQMALDNGGRLHLIYNTPDRVKYGSKDANEDTWELEVIHSALSYSIALGVSNSGIPYVFYGPPYNSAQYACKVNY